MPMNHFATPLLPPSSPRNLTDSLTFDLGQWSSTTRTWKDQSMAEPPTSPSRAKEETRAESKQLLEEATTPKNRLFFGLPGLDCPQAPNLEANANPFANLCEGSQGADLRTRIQEDAMEGRSIEGRRKHAPKLVSPKQESHQSLPRTPQQETMPGGKRGQLHSEVHPSFFSSLSISIPPNRKLFRARVWAVLVRDKNSQKETLVHSKNQTQPSLPLNIRITRPANAEWSHKTAWADLIQRLEVELEEKVLRYRLTLKDQRQVKWSWQEEMSRGGRNAPS
jgi:hypothetical protein